MNFVKFFKKVLVSIVVVCVMFIFVVFVQSVEINDDMVEVIEVCVLSFVDSLQKVLIIKRVLVGVVDIIFVEDIVDFLDQNLVELL